MASLAMNKNLTPVDRICISGSLTERPENHDVDFVKFTRRNQAGAVRHLDAQTGVLFCRANGERKGILRNRIVIDDIEIFRHFLIKEIVAQGERDEREQGCTGSQVHSSPGKNLKTLALDN